MKVKDIRKRRHSIAIPSIPGDFGRCSQPSDRADYFRELLYPYCRPCIITQARPGVSVRKVSMQPRSCIVT